MLTLCGFPKEQTNEEGRGKPCCFGIPLLALHKISARLGLDPAVFGPELSLGKSGRDRTGGEVVALPMEGSPG